MVMMGGIFGKPRMGAPMSAQDAYGRAPVFQPPQQVDEKPKGDGTKRVIGILGDFLLGLGGQQGVYGPMAYQKRMMDQRAQQEAQQAQQQRAASWEDWQKKFDYERLNAPPPRNDTIEDFNWYKGLSEKDRAVYDQMRPVVIDGPDGRYVVPRSGLQGNQSPRPVPQSEWDRATPMGGASPSGAPPFAVRRGFNPSGLPGERITGTLRSPARNRAVGGVPNSYHLTGQARDSVPPPGMSMAEYYRRLKAANPGMDVINEGDHVHIEPRGR